jgi:hypothetical protein
MLDDSVLLRTCSLPFPLLVILLRPSISYWREHRLWRAFCALPNCTLSTSPRNSDDNLFFCIHHELARVDPETGYDICRNTGPLPIHMRRSCGCECGTPASPHNLLLLSIPPSYHEIMTLSFTGHTVVITGAGGGLGKACVNAVRDP